MERGRGRFITLEGGEGAGKSTQARRLRQRLEGRGLEVLVTREPGGSPRAEIIREALLCGAVKPFGVLAETLMFAAARADHVEHVVRPALRRGAYVVCDRFVDSSRVYQGSVAGLDPGILRSFERVAVGDTVPDLTLILDVPAKLGMARATQRRELTGQSADRFEDEALSFHAHVRDAFLAIAAAEPERCVVVDAAGQPDRVEREIWLEVETRFLTPSFPSLAA